MGKGRKTFLQKGFPPLPQSSKFPPRLFDQLADAVQADVGQAVGGPVDAPCKPANVLAVEEAPETGVRGVVAVVAKGEELVLGHGDGSPVVAARDHDQGLRMLGIGLLHGHTVAVENLVAHFERIAGHPRDALDVVETPVLGITEDDDVPHLRLTAPDQVVVIEGIAQAVDEFVDQQMIPDLKRFQHRTGRNLESLHNEGRQDERKGHGPQEGFGVFPYHVLAQPLEERKFFVHKGGGP